MSEYDAIVYDLDGTLVDLAVDWNAVAIDVIAVYARAAADPPSENLWELLEAASKLEIAPAVEETIADHEREGARRSRRLARADELLERSVPVGVCSLNCEAACRIALDEHALESAVDAVVGRDTVETRKPDPEPLLETVRGLDAEPATTLFVGDTERDERTAIRAGVDFEYVGTGTSGV
ncbi:HAD family hydrolase [Natronococcus jeotgali]|uniref:HAD-superfamily hydrolase, subfamily IA, variant 1 n=1 Tax=Natronococcus jeotgali DSM 18795 TaxID=1227498 RepID=L9X590_9EURY|nr:HAD family hydrolase [Natronococcus jeotgali]ELY56944.1 HAD-superfamily hydrolase, subfamily IA, variant 1 [Natronococcus jeotgali DSM 18795]